MGRLMLLLIFLLWFVSLTKAQSDSLRMVDIQVIEAKEIEASGYGRLSDLLQLLERGTIATLNGDKWFMQFGAASNYQNQNYLILVNGVKIPITIPDACDINSLAISTKDIERIEFAFGSGMYLNEFAEKGIINIITKQSIKGIHYRGYYNEGNETGDPGPFRYLPNTNQNVDKMGLNYNHHVSFAHKSFNSNITYQYQDNFFRESSIFNRVNNRNPPTSKANQVGLHHTTSFKTKNSNHYFFGYFSQQHDYPFEPTYLEIETKKRNIGLSYKLDYISNNQHQISMQISLYSRETEPTLSNIYPVQLGINNLSALFLFEPKIKNTRRKLSYSIEGDAFQTNQLPIQKNGVLLKSNGSFIQTLGSGKKIILSAQLNTDSYKMGYKFQIGITKQNPRWMQGIEIGLHRRLSIEDKNYLWHYHLLNNTINANVTLQSTLNYRAIRTINKNNQLKFSFSAIANTGIQGYTLESPIIDSNGVLWPGSLVQTNMENSHMLTFHLGYSHHFNNKNIIRFSTYSQQNIGTHIALNKAQTTLRIMADYTCYLPKRFSVWVKSYYQAPSRWQHNILMGSMQQDQQKLDGFSSVDFTLNKSALKQMLTLSLTVRNIFNSYEIYHPLGAIFSLRMYVAIQFSI